MTDAILTMTFEATTDQLRLAGTSFHQPTTFGKCIGVSVELPCSAKTEAEEAVQRRTAVALARALDALRTIERGSPARAAIIAAEVLARIRDETKAST
jgi:hypothetical protein